MKDQKWTPEQRERLDEAIYMMEEALIALKELSEESTPELEDGDIIIA